jgi:uncharacterized protein
MRNKYVWFLALMLLLGSSVLIAAPADPKFLTIGTAASGGAYYPIGIAMADIITNKIGIQTTAQITGGAIENNSLIQNRSVDIAISQGVMSYNAVKGLPPYKEPLKDVVGMFNGLSKGVFQLVVNKNSSIKSIKDLKGKKVALGPAGGGAITTFLEVFAAYGYTEKDFQAIYTSYEQAADSLVDGNLDAILVQAALPSPAITQQTAANKPLRFIAIEDEMMKKLLKKYSYYSKIVIPKEMYNTEAPVNTFYIANMVVVNKQLSTDLVYRITKAFFENIDTIRNSHPSVKGLTIESAVEGLPIALHPGARKYFKEKGLIK